MKTLFIRNFGCRATQADAAAIRDSLISRGYRIAEDEWNADTVILNTCTVTAAADAEARESIRHIHRQNPAARIVATGCYAQRAPEELASIPGVSCVIGNSHQQAIGDLITSSDFVPSSKLAASAPSPPIFRKEMLGNSLPMHSSDSQPLIDLTGDVRTRPTLKIQDGCNHRCAYCVIPVVRGRSRSIEPGSVLNEIRRLADAGAQEVVLSGIDLGSYGRDLEPRASLHGLVRQIMRGTSIASLRLSSIEPIDITQDFVELVASEPRIAPHFHMPLQSGSDRILRAMHRWYRTAHYARRVEIIHEILPNSAIGADVITGFPGETDQDHAETMNFLSTLPLSYLHVFSFSARPGTEAASLPGAVPARIVHMRAQELRALGHKKSQEFRASQAGRKTRALTLHRQQNGWTSAITGNYLNIRIAGSWPRNRWLEVRLPANDSPVTAVEL